MKKIIKKESIVGGPGRPPGRPILPD